MNSASRGSPPNPRGWYPPPSRPRPVEGGLKARSARGAIARTWWSERFIAVLEDIGLGNRLQRGRTYARKGQVISLEVDPGSVTAEVQGSRARPYRIRIGIPAFGKSEWAQVERSLAENAWYTAKLLSGEMPDDIEDVFAGLGLSLFPATAGELSLDCSCPDYAVPCKHLAATPSLGVLALSALAPCSSRRDSYADFPYRKSCRRIRELPTERRRQKTSGMETLSVLPTQGNLSGF